MVSHKRSYQQKIRVSITLFLIDVIHNGSHGHWSYKVRVPWNLLFDVIFVLISIIFDLRRKVKKLKRLFQEGVELCLSLYLILFIYNSFYIIFPYIFTLSFWPTIPTQPAISTGYWCLSLQGRYVFVFLVCNYGHNGGFIGRILLHKSNMVTDIMYAEWILCGL